MKILVANNTFCNPGGSETYSYSIIEELVYRGYNVEAFTPNKCKNGIVTKEIEKLSVKIHYSIPNGPYDLILLSHTSTASKLINVPGFKIQTCHGIFPNLEQPYPGMDAYVSITDEVSKYLSTKGISSTIINNGINCNRFNIKKIINDKLTKILSLIQDDYANDLLEEACDKLGITLIKKYHKEKNPRFDIENIINDVDLVVSLGRGIYESMACGRNVLIFDSRNYGTKLAYGDGLITNDDDANKFLQNNCSGRYSNKVFTVDDLINELQKYKPEYGYSNHNFTIRNLNIISQVDKYLDIKNQTTLFHIDVDLYENKINIVSDSDIDNVNISIFELDSDVNNFVYIFRRTIDFASGNKYWFSSNKKYKEMNVFKIQIEKNNRILKEIYKFNERH